MTTATADPVTRDELDALLARLTDDDKDYVLLKLLPDVLRVLTHRAHVFDEAGEWVGEVSGIRRKWPAGPVVDLHPIQLDDLATGPRLTADRLRDERATWEKARAEHAGGNGA